MKSKHLLLTIFALVIITGCMAKKNLSIEDKNRISTVTINEQVIVSKDLWYTGPETAFGVLGLLVEKATINTEDKIKNLAYENNIDIGEIVKNEIKRELSNQDHFLIIEKGVTDSTLQINVKIYGLCTPNPFAKSLNPILMVEASLFDREGKVVWQSTSHQNKGTQTVTIDEIFQNPELLRNTWKTAASKAASEIINTL